MYIAGVITERYTEAKKGSGPVDLDKIVRTAEWEFNLSPGTIKKSRIIKRHERNKKTTGKLTNGRTKSPLDDIEATLVEFALQRSLVKRPFSKQELIDFTNSLIDGTVLQAKLTAWQVTTKTREAIRGTVGNKWYTNFMRRNPILASKSVVKYGVKRSEWVTMDNFEFMYHHTYRELVKAGVAKVVQEEEYLDVHGNVVSEHDDAKLGKKTKYRMVYPRYLFFVDEVGSNTHAEKDKTSKEKRVCHRDDRPQQVSSSSDHHYTTLPFTNGLGEPVCCCIIIAGESNTVLDVMGIDYMNMGDDYLSKDTSREDAMSFFEANMTGDKKKSRVDLPVLLVTSLCLHLSLARHPGGSPLKYSPMH